MGVGVYCGVVFLTGSIGRVYVNGDVRDLSKLVKKLVRYFICYTVPFLNAQLGVNCYIQLAVELVAKPSNPNFAHFPYAFNMLGYVLNFINHFWFNAAQ